MNGNCKTFQKYVYSLLYHSNIKLFFAYFLLYFEVIRFFSHPLFQVADVSKLDSPRRSIKCPFSPNPFPPSLLFFVIIYIMGVE